MHPAQFAEGAYSNALVPRAFSSGAVTTVGSPGHALLRHWRKQISELVQALLQMS